MTTALHLPKFLTRLAGVAAVASLSFTAQADSLSIPDYSSRAEVGTLTFTNGSLGSTHTEGPGYLGSYRLSNNDWVYCLSPYTNAPTGAMNYNQVSLGTYLSVGGAYDQQFVSYGALAPGYAAQPKGFVLNKIVELYDWAYADTLTGNIQDKSAGFAFALWEVEGEAAAGWGTAAGNLKVSGISGAAMTYADKLLGALRGDTTWAAAGFNSFATYTFDVWVPDPLSSSQSFLTVSNNPNRNDTPEPATGLLLAAAALAFIGSRRVKKAV